MPEYRTPGVYIEERDTGPRPITGVGTSTAGILGRTERGPTDPRLVTSFAQFERLYGGFEATVRGRELEDSYTPFGVEGFFRNGGTECVFGRVVGKDAELAEGSLGAMEALLAVSTSAVDFGDVVVGHAPTRTVTLSNPGEAGDPTVTVMADAFAFDVAQGEDDEFEVVTPAGAAFPLTVEAGGRVDVTVRVTPADTGSKAATLVVDHDGTNAPAGVTFAAEGVDETANTFAVDPTALGFEATVDGHERSESVTVRNLDANDDLALTAAELTVEDPGGEGDDAHFSAGFPDGEPGAVPPGDTAEIEVTFSPDGAPGDVEARLAIDSGASPVTLSGNGVAPTDGALGVPDEADPQLDFGTLVAGERTRATVTLWNLGDGDPAAGHATIDVDPEAIEAVLAPNEDPAADDFAVLGPEEVSTLAPGAHVDVEVRFEPTEPGGRIALLRVPFDAEGTGGTATVTLTGTAVEPAPLTLGEDRLDFGRIDAGDDDDRTLVLTNAAETGGQAVQIAEDGVQVEDLSGDSPFAVEVIDPDTGSPPAFPVDLDPGDELRARVTFVARDLDPRTATLSVTYEGRAGANPAETRAVPLTANRDVLDLAAIGPGAWGGRIAVSVDDAARDTAGESGLFNLTVQYWSDPADAAAAEQAYAIDPEDVPAPTVEEVYDDVSPVRTGSDFYENRLAGSALVAAEYVADGRPESTDEPVWLSSPDGESPDEGRVPVLEDYTGAFSAPAPEWLEADERVGLDGFLTEDEIAVVCVPDESKDPGLTDAIVDHCENQKDRFAVLQAPQVAGEPGDVEPPRDSEYAAFYYPWIRTTNPATNLPTLVPPGGHVAGIYARNDANRGVHKAPANETVRGANGLQVSITKGEQGQLNPRGVNCIRSFPGRGIRVWGARTTSSDPLWRYVNVRRLFLFIEESIEEATQYAVFEPNDERLWAQIRQAVSNFLTTRWRNGALAGSTPEEAFYVRCDETTMTQDEIDNGQLIVEVGVAPVKPAEFVIFRVSQKTGEAA